MAWYFDFHAYARFNLRLILLLVPSQSKSQSWRWQQFALEAVARKELLFRLGLVGGQSPSSRMAVPSRVKFATSTLRTTGKLWSRAN